MSASAQGCLGRSQSPYGLSGNKNLWSILLLAMNKLKPATKILPRGMSPEAISNALRDYLDGYFQSFDYYPVCTRHIYSRNDAYALWSDFLKVADDLSYSAGEMVSSPERFLNLGSFSGDELARRKQQAATRSVEHIIEQFPATAGTSATKSDPT